MPNSSFKVGLTYCKPLAHRTRTYSARDEIEKTNNRELKAQQLSRRIQLKSQCRDFALECEPQTTIRVAASAAATTLLVGSPHPR